MLVLKMNLERKMELRVGIKRGCFKVLNSWICPKCSIEFMSGAMAHTQHQEHV
ncbi:hypothetical protein Hanom_Chr02g00147541 [Helianthus anomalus]